MLRASSTEFRARFGEFIDRAIVTPIMLQRYGHDAVVFLAPEEYARLLSLAEAAEVSGTIAQQELESTEV